VGLQCEPAPLDLSSGSCLRWVGRARQWARPKGVWTHAFDDGTAADTVIKIEGFGFALFAADAGLEDAAGGGSVQFAVLVDGRVAERSPVLRQGQVHRFRLDVSGAKQITLRVTNGGDGNTCDHAAWAMARFIVEGKADPWDSSTGDASKWTRSCPVEPYPLTGTVYSLSCHSNERRRPPGSH